MISGKTTISDHHPLVADIESLILRITFFYFFHSGKNGRKSIDNTSSLFEEMVSDLRGNSFISRKVVACPSARPLKV
jgi:hypothetical protein